MRGRLDEAVVELRRVSELAPQSAQAHHRLALALQAQNNFAPAIVEYGRVLELEPNHSVAANNLAWILATAPDPALRDGAKAVELALRCRQISGDQPVILDTLAAAYAEKGLFPEAVRTATQALQLAKAQSNAALASEIERRLENYRNQSPFHQNPAAQ
jgi:Flp pilus assembly protein TadD